MINTKRQNKREYYPIVNKLSYNLYVGVSKLKGNTLNFYKCKYTKGKG